MTETIKQLQAHRSYRDFAADYVLPAADLAAILKASRQAPSWMNGQFYSILVITDQAKRQQLVELNKGNPHLLTSSVFLLYVADFNRTQQVSEHYQQDYCVAGNYDALITATTDAALAMENALVAAESLGLGTCPIGSIRKDAAAIIELFGLPAYTVPLFGLAIGKPTVEMKVKPRLPEAAVVHYEHYQPWDYQEIVDYDQEMAVFGEARETKRWSKKFADYFETSPNKGYEKVLQQQKLL